MFWSKATLPARWMMAMMMLAAGIGGVGFADQPAPRTDAHGDPLPPRAIARLGTLRFRDVRGCLAFSPDGKRLAAATGPAGERITLWDTAGRREVKQIVGRATLTRLVFSPDGRRLIASDNSRTCRVLDVETGKELFELSGTHGTFSADGKTIVTCQSGASSVVRSWDARTGKELLAREFPLNIREFTVAGDGRTLAVTESPNGPVLVKVLDFTKGAETRSFAIAWNGAAQLTLSADGKTLASTNLNTVRLWNVADGKMIGAWNHRNVSRAVFSPDGKYLAWTGQDEKGGFARLWVVECDGGKLRAIGPGDNYPQAPCFSADGKRLAVVTSSGVLCVRDLASGKETLSLDAHDRPILDVVFDADGRHVISRGGEDIFSWQTRTGKLLHRGVLLPPGHEYLAPLLPGGYSLTGERTSNPLQGRFWLRDMRTGEDVLRFDGRPDVGPPQAAAAPGGRYVAVRGRAGEICLLDVRARRCVHRLDAKEQVSALHLSADGDVLVWFRRTSDSKSFEVHVHRRSSEKTLVLRDMPKTERWIWIFNHHQSVSPDGRWFVFATEEGRLRRWDLTTGKELPPLSEALRTAWELCWSPDGRFVAARGSASPASVVDPEAQRDVRVWDVRTGTRLAHLTLPNRQGGMHSKFSHDGRTLATSDLQGIISLWEVQTGKRRATLKGHLPGEIAALAFSADDRLLVSGGHDSQALAWDMTGRMPDGQWRSVQLSPAQRRAAWETLASGDAKAACTAMWLLTADAPGSTAFLAEHLKPVPRPKSGQVAALIAALDSEKFEERQRASRELETLDESAADELRQTLKGKPSLEVRRRVEALLGRLEHVPSGEQLRALRAIEALEHIGTAEARDVLRKLAEGVPQARITREAQAARTRSGSGESGSK